VDDILTIHGKDEGETDKFIERMKTEDVTLHKEGTGESYIGRKNSQKQV
jgi:hypothetical protein